MDFKELLIYENFIEYFRKESDGEHLSGLDVLERIGQLVESMTLEGLEDAVHDLYQKWPQSRIREHLERGIKRRLQTEHYEELYRNDIPKVVLKRDDLAIHNMDLKDEKYVHRSEPLKKAKPVNGSKKPRTRNHTPRVRKPKSALSEKINNMTLEAVIKWALECGVDQDKIDAYRQKTIGLAKMNLCNAIRHKIKNDPKYKDLLD